MMCWIGDLKKELGPLVKLVAQRGHEHWGFETGEVYEIVKNERHGNEFALRGLIGGIITQYSPTDNYGNNWKFETANISLENE